MASSTQLLSPSGPAASSTRPVSGRRGCPRCLKPSLLDCFFASILVWLFASGSAGWSSLLADADTGWHIRTGEWIVANGMVPARDLFSFSRPGAPWFAWEWLADVVFFLLYQFAGLKALVLFAGLLIAVVTTILLRQMLEMGANTLAAFVVALLATGASTLHHLARPHVFTLLLLAVSLWILNRDRINPGRAVWLLVPITILWTNLHGGFLALIACLGLLAAGRAAEAWRGGDTGPGRWNGVRRYSLLFAACSAATLANPYGIALHAHIYQYLRSDWIRQVVQEFQSPVFRGEHMLQFQALLFIGLITGAALCSRGRLAEALWIFFWAHQSLSSARHIPLFVIVAAPFIAAEVSNWWRMWASGAGPASVAGVLDKLAADLSRGFGRLTVWAAAPVLALVFFQPADHWPRDFPKELFPAELVKEHRQRLAGARVFTSDQWADYLLFHYYPRHKVFVDGRSDFYGPEIGGEYLKLLHAKREWRAILERRNFEYVLCPPDWPLASLLKLTPGWRVLGEDERAILFHQTGWQPEAGGTVAATTNFAGSY